MFVIFYAYEDGDGYLIHRFLGMADTYEKAEKLIITSSNYDSKCKIVRHRSLSMNEFTRGGDGNHFVIEQIDINKLSEH
ncbi:MAG TPA: hypothetical protein VLG50_08450 [Candidatus Saccharimonadales bacterium]|nr:hypothetical protein [Candidatus Saccharimonadales bacterium]